MLQPCNKVYICIETIPSSSFMMHLWTAFLFALVIPVENRWLQLDLTGWVYPNSPHYVANCQVGCLLFHYHKGSLFPFVFPYDIPQGLRFARGRQNPKENSLGKKSFLPDLTSLLKGTFLRRLTKFRSPITLYVKPRETAVWKGHVELRQFPPLEDEAVRLIAYILYILQHGRHIPLHCPDIEPFPTLPQLRKTFLLLQPCKIHASPDFQLNSKHVELALG